MSQSHLDPADMLPASDGVTSPVSYSRSSDERFEVSVLMSSDAFSALAGLAESTGQELKDVIGKAFLLYQAAVEAQGRGKVVGVASSEDVLETVFTDL